MTARLEQVTVYARGARVRRSVPIAAGATEAGARAIRVGGLPLGVIDDAVRAEVRGTGLVAGVRVVLDPAIASQTGPIGDDLHAARARLAAADAELAAIDAALTALAALTPSPRRGPHGGDAPAPWAEVFDARLALHELRLAREGALRTRHAAAVRERRTAREQLEAALEQAARAGATREVKLHELHKAVVVDLLPDAGVLAGEVVVEYAVGGARWVPSYGLVLGRGPARLELRAHVAQCTGEDWRGVALTVSTALPLRHAELPELPAARIGRGPVAPRRRGFRPPPSPPTALYADFDRAFPGRGGAGQHDARPFTGKHTAKEVTYVGATPQGPGLADGAAASEERVRRRADDFDDDEVAVMAPAPARAAAEHAPEPGGEPPRGGGPRRALAAAPPALAKAADGPAPGSARAPLEPAASADELHARLAYAELRMPGPASPRRGVLDRLSPRERYEEALRTDGAVLAASAEELALAASERAQQIDLLDLPAGTSDEWDHSYDYAFDGDGQFDLVADGAWHAVTLSTVEVAVQQRHLAVPREADGVFRMAAFTNAGPGPLLPGPVDVHDAGLYLLTTPLAGASAGAGVELGLGIDPRIKLARNCDFREEASGILRGGHRLDHTISVELRNLGPAPVEVEVRERVPVSRDGDDHVEVTVTRCEPRWDRWTPDPAGPAAPRLRGGYRWRITVPPGERRTLAAEYAVRVGRGLELAGGNRREA
ncbi:MAG: DUF4139 domain-containing protein [Kofleriaceae bacterium]|nr:DUF4139 domain-containing protein [Kofleriaceae bacterium]